ncbi:hypothetical protein pb186bvf_017712 [Paramecium bursaria]
MDVVENYIPHDQKYSYENLEKLPNFGVHLSEKIYFGQIFNQKRHGMGVLIISKRVYEGQFNNNRKHGRGYEYFENGSTYEGDYLNGKPDGLGTFRWANGEMYQGEWANGLRQGQGIWIGVKNDSYQGQWHEGKPHGKGIHQSDGDVYEGEFRECLKYGYGEEHFENGDIFKGYYVNGKPDGEGEYVWVDGSCFKGHFVNGLRCGYGEFIGNSYSYRGYYLNDRKHGFGEMTFKDGNVYSGNFVNDNKCQEYQDKQLSNEKSSIQPIKMTEASKKERMTQNSFSQTKPRKLYSLAQSPHNKTIQLKSSEDESVQKKPPPPARPQSLPRPSLEQTLKKGNSITKNVKNQTQKPDFNLKIDNPTSTYKTRTGLVGIKFDQYQCKFLFLIKPSISTRLQMTISQNYYKIRDPTSRIDFIYTLQPNSITLDLILEQVKEISLSFQRELIDQLVNLQRDLEIDDMKHGNVVPRNIVVTFSQNQFKIALKEFFSANLVDKDQFMWIHQQLILLKTVAKEFKLKHFELDQNSVEVFKDFKMFQYSQVKFKELFYLLLFLQVVGDKTKVQTSIKEQSKHICYAVREIKKYLNRHFEKSLKKEFFTVDDQMIKDFFDSLFFRGFFNDPYMFIQQKISIENDLQLFIRNKLTEKLQLLYQ